ncbi:ACT domain-containing protein [Marinobacter sp. 2_MG-2023]|uniref:ACT domain-containing protein n=1 Tax=Marinobacter sp. 2_MG-2023 TaxID=3062679 RepID=UPI0026E1AE79|nr:ACT domain-containing protein [Marinobacter sp. 2_MG-2023]MDO6440960.1 ACT domain-containing protein [Marinobacter sp. 2_MG-2023]
MITDRSNVSPSYTITCRMNHEAAALERLCQVVRIRGFRIEKMAVETTNDFLDIALTVQGTRHVTMLQSQLEKLHTVAEVILTTPAMMPAATRSA